MPLLARVLIGYILISSPPSWGQGLLPLIVPSPLTIALTVGQWIMKDSQKAYYVRVESTAPTPAQARAEGFKLAVSQAVGTLIVAESEVKNQQLVRSEIIQYSSGYIQDFKILSESQVGSMSRVVMDIWVTESKIADRLLNISKADGTVEGEKSAVQYQNNLNQLESGDKLLELVLKDFPSKAFDITIGKSIVSMPARDVRIQIPITIAWNTEYISSLTEVLEKIRQGKSPNNYRNKNEWAGVLRFKGKSDWFMSTASFRDRLRLMQIDQALILSEPLIKIIIKDDAGGVRYAQCFRYPGLTGAYLGEPSPIIGYLNTRNGLRAGQFFSYGGDYGQNSNAQSADMSIFGDFSDDIPLTLDLSPQLAREKLMKMDKAEVSVVKGIECR